jgi:uncharacterized protein
MRAKLTKPARLTLSRFLIDSFGILWAYLFGEPFFICYIILIDMKIYITAKPGSKKESVEKISENVFKVSVKERPEGGKANEAIEKALAEYFNISPARVWLVAGLKSRKKVAEIN